MRCKLGLAVAAVVLCATSAPASAVVVWPHHVGKIVGGAPGHWAVLSRNDGHRVRTRVRSIAGAIAFRD